MDKGDKGGLTLCFMSSIISCEFVESQENAMLRPCYTFVTLHFVCQVQIEVCVPHTTDHKTQYKIYK